jgi:two-component system, OmpR family, response regulator
MRLLIIEDDVSLREHTAQLLTQLGHTVTAVGDGVQGLKAAKQAVFDVLLIDRMLPRMDGLEVIRNIRLAGITTAIIILSALGEVDDRVKGLRGGGDDYLVKPFAMEELTARLEILSRRANAQAQPPTIINIADLHIDCLARKVSRASKVISLQGREFRLLEFLARNKGQHVTRSMLLEAVWDYHFDPQTNIIDVHISRLRTKIDKGFDKPLLKTIRGSGYVLDET